MTSIPMEHAFAPYVRILGKGKQGSRSLSREEARSAFGMILDGEVRPEQLGAFLMLLRVKEESPEELAGFVDAVKQRVAPPAGVSVDLDWATYAGKRRRLPWFLLAALLLAENGVRVLMHGARGHTAGRIYVEECLGLFGRRPAGSWSEVGRELERGGFAYTDVGLINPKLGEIINLRSILGLRSPVHTLCRLLNPLDAPYRIDGVFHPAYGPMHQRSARLLEQLNSVTVKGDGGEAEIQPDNDCRLQWVDQGAYRDELWPRRFEQRTPKEAELDPEDLWRLWRGEIAHPYGEAAVVQTLALCLRLLGRASERPEAVNLAERWWQSRRALSG